MGIKFQINALLVALLAILLTKILIFVLLVVMSLSISLPIRPIKDVLKIVLLSRIYMHKIVVEVV
jgi:hypothetical protein